MKLRLLSGLILLTASAFPQQPRGGLNRLEAFKGTPRQPAADASASDVKVPKLLGAEFFFILPHVVDGLVPGQGVFTTEYHVINLDPNNPADFELDFFTQAGVAAEVGIACPATLEISGVACTSGTVTSETKLTGVLDKGQIITYVTGGLPASAQVTWAEINVNTSGPFTAVYETINLANVAANYLSSTAVVSDYGVQNTTNVPGLYLPFDNTNSAETSAAFANPDFLNSYNVNNLEIYFINSSGTLFDTETFTLAPGTQNAIIIANQWPKTVNIAGTMYIVPYTPAAGDTPASFPTFSPITILAIQGKYLNNAMGFSHSNAIVPLMAIGCYTGTGC